MTSDRPQTAYPLLRYDDPAAALDWLAQAFGFEEVARHPGPDGDIVHAELRAGDDTIMFSSTGPADSPFAGAAGTTLIYVAVDDPDAHFERSRAAGAEVVRELRDEDYGSRDYAVRDPEGNIWSFGTYRP